MSLKQQEEGDAYKGVGTADMKRMATCCFQAIGDEKEEQHMKKVNDGLGIIDDLNDNDILSKAEDLSRPGNVGFEMIIQEYTHAYNEAQSREQKNAVVHHVLSELAKRNPNGRFVKKLPGDRYALLLEESVLSKVARALNDATSVEQRPKRKRRQEKHVEAPKQSRRDVAPRSQESSLGKVAQELLQMVLVSKIVLRNQQ